MKVFLSDPGRIEKESMEIIAGILGDVAFNPEELKVVKRVIHTTADFEYAQLLEFNHAPLEAFHQAVRKELHLVTDSGMAMAGINRRVLSKYGVEVKCFMAEEQVALEAKERGLTRAMVSMEYAVKDKKKQDFCNRQCADCSEATPEVDRKRTGCLECHYRCTCGICGSCRIKRPAGADRYTAHPDPGQERRE